ncbi:hypothetical protein AURDEDRAFT_176810 [Auricularia subglabra TFB-10046 SS5]|uniref:Uncharacterized protein n=1 Tax=Auricularia subglabra (strain TFB-10046 / SS5) TaxID=717982 RepID=J0CUU2_AURST|nr:hypothetical protein AURDEDRAFT_176810 [Auricularia subglabra TFB-10046 SS5]
MQSLSASRSWRTQPLALLGLTPLLRMLLRLVPLLRAPLCLTLLTPVLLDLATQPLALLGLVLLLRACPSDSQRRRLRSSDTALHPILLVSQCRWQRGRWCTLRALLARGVGAALHFVLFTAVQCRRPAGHQACRSSPAGSN